MKNILKLFIFLMFGIFLMGLANAFTTTLTTPASGDNITGTAYPLLITITWVQGIDNSTGEIANCTVSTTTDGVIWTKTGNASSYTVNIDTTTNVTEKKQTSFTATCSNITGASSSSDTNTLVDIDNTIPTVSFDIDYPIIKTYKPITLDCSRSSDTTDLTYDLSINSSDGSSATGVKADSDGIYEFRESETQMLGEYKAYCVVKDEVDKKSGTNLTFYIKSESAPVTAKETPAEKATKRGTSNAIYIIIGGGVLFLLLIIIIIVMYMMKKK